MWNWDSQIIFVIANHRPLPMSLFLRCYSFKLQRAQFRKFSVEYRVCKQFPFCNSYLLTVYTCVFYCFKLILIMSTRQYLSGAAKRKLKLVQENRNKKNGWVNGSICKKKNRYVNYKHNIVIGDMKFIIIIQ